MSSVDGSSSLMGRLLTAGAAACIADLATFPLDTAKVRLQVQGEGASMMMLESRYHGMFGTLSTIARQEGPKSLYNGLSAGLQRQMCFSSIRIGLYDSVKTYYQSLLNVDEQERGGAYFGVRVAAGITTGGLAVIIAQPTDVVKVRLQAQRGPGRYSSTLHAYRAIAQLEGARGLWRGFMPNIGRNAIVNVAEIVCYDVIKDAILHRGLLEDNIVCHFSAASVAGLCATLVASPVDVVKTRYMNSGTGEYKGAIDCGVRMFIKEGPMSFYKGFTPSFCRLVSWNIAMWITYEQMKIMIVKLRKSRDTML